MWHVSSRSGVATLRTAMHLLLTYLPSPCDRCHIVDRILRTTWHGKLINYSRYTSTLESPGDILLPAEMTSSQLPVAGQSVTCTPEQSFLAAMAVFVSCKKKNWNAKNMASAGARAYIGVWGRCPQRGPGAEPLVKGSGGEAPLKLKSFYCRREQICHSHLSET